MASRLDHLVLLYRTTTFAESTKCTYSSYLRRYLCFCKMMDILPVPICQKNLARYIVYLTESLQYSSVRQYLNIVRILHEEAGLSNPIIKNWFLSSLLTGVRRSLGDTCKPKLPITCEILYKIAQTLAFGNSFDMCFWCCCVVAFFSFLRKSHLLAKSQSNWGNVLRREDVKFMLDHVELVITCTKTIQFQERNLVIPLAHISHSPLSPAQAVMTVFEMGKAGSRDRPLFQFQTAQGGSQVLSYALFISQLHKSLAQAGINPPDYSGHSFRRGGASLAFDCNLPPDYIKLLGDWRSNAYQRYLEPSTPAKLKLSSILAQKAICMFRHSQ